MGKSKKAVTKTYQIRVSNFAYQNIDEIISFIAFENQQPLNAIKVSEAIENMIVKISQNPFAYKECEQLPTKTKSYRRAVCLSWLIIYKNCKRRNFNLKHYTRLQKSFKDQETAKNKVRDNACYTS